jgi:hypothetical protein
MGATSRLKSTLRASAAGAFPAAFADASITVKQMMTSKIWLFIGLPHWRFPSSSRDLVWPPVHGTQLFHRKKEQKPPS